jgi:hypothetical protein
MRLQIFFGTVLALLVSGPLGTEATSQSAGSQMKAEATSATCPVTLPRKRTAPFDAMSYFEAGSSNWKPSLYAALSRDGTAVFRPGGAGSIEPDGSLSTKWAWTRGPGLRGKLTIRGKRLDAAAPPLRAIISEGYGDTGFQATTLIFPTEGCWEVTGEVGDTRLTFVTRVVRLREHN